ncbi:MAG: hypothetical protein CMJ46_06720 [Planctomyces sp.]|nr:hypothetical protein [Planctomyces sp.]
MKDPHLRIERRKSNVDPETLRYASFKFYLKVLHTLAAILLILSLIGWSIFSLASLMASLRFSIHNGAFLDAVLYSAFQLALIIFIYATLRALIEAGTFLMDIDRNSRRTRELLETQSKAE